MEDLNETVAVVTGASSGIGRATARELLSAGARVVLTSTNPRAIRAIHEFLRFQIEDHRTGDSVEVQP